MLSLQDAQDDPRALVGMVTWEAAKIAGLSGLPGQPGHTGDLQPGLPADICVLERCHGDPWESVLRSDPSCVQMTMMAGNVAYARSDWYTQVTGVWGRSGSRPGGGR